ncbi:MAG TPA: hypothetical protein ENN87_11850 [Phycisphaerales bacterium]|nr:hypothetical protein [Phycisphaerales bacterium]
MWRINPLGIQKSLKTSGIGRNDPCPCGSGKKFKYCCLGKENSTASSHGAAGMSES